MSEPDKDKIELEIRRVISDRELEVRRSTIEELEKHRNYLQTQFRTFTLGLSALAIAGSALFAFFFSKSFNDLEKDVIAQIDQKVIDYRILETMKIRLNEQIKIVAESESIKDRIRKTADTVLSRQVTSKIGPLINDAIARETNGLDQANVSSIIDKSVRSNIGWKQVAPDNSDAFDINCEYKWNCNDGKYQGVTFYATSISNSELRSITMNRPANISYVVVFSHKKGEYHGDGDGRVVLYKRCN